MSEADNGAAGPVAPFDIGHFQDSGEGQEQGREIEIIDLHGSKTGVFFYIFGEESSAYRAAVDHAQEWLVEQKKLTPETAEERVAFHVKRLAGCIKYWRTGEEKIVILRGEKVSFTRAHAERILAIPGFGQVRAQLEVEIKSAAGFIKGSAPA